MRGQGVRAHGVAVAAVAGAWVAPAVAVWTVPAVGLVWFGLRRSRAAFGALMAAVFVLTAASATHAHSGLDFPDAGPFDGWVTLVDDPRASGPVGVRVTVRSGRQRLVVSGHGAVAGRIDDALAGERIHLVGTIRPVSRGDDRSIHRHVVGRVTVEDVVAFADGAPVAAAANAVRRTLEGGAGSLSRDDRALFLGMVIGDDRDQGPVTADDFRAAGLGHVLVVSGQNVAFVLAVAMPLAGRFRPAGRAAVLLTVLGLFAVMTRFEPSVLRATAMAGLGIGSSALGRPSDGRTGLSLAVAGLLVIDPFLVHIVAFRLSAAATAGIVWLGPGLADRLPLPSWLAVPVSTTVAAQLAVSPVLVAIFGPIPLASLPANLLAGPASGAVMIWGCTGGVLAGVAGDPLATVLHWPTRALLWWVGEVAELSAAAPTATLGGWALAGIAGAVIAALRLRSKGIGIASALFSGVVCALALLVAPEVPDGVRFLGDGVTLVSQGDQSVVILDDPGRARDVLERLRMAGARQLVLIVALDGDRADADAVLALHDRFGSIPTAAPPLHRVPGARTVRPGRLIRAGSIEVEVLEVEPRIEFIASFA